MANLSKADILNLLSGNLEVFLPHLHGYFLCPICLAQIPLREKNKITEAHIIPKAAGGKLKTYLCCNCNSLLGAKQDKWFGEYMRLASQEKSSIFETKIKDGGFWIEGVRVNGRWEYDRNRGLSFTEIVQQNPPHINEKVGKIFSSRPSKMDIKVSFPLLKQETMIRLGVLTAGYLMWFRLFGYSWVLQSHLQPIRDYILTSAPDTPKTWAVFGLEKFRWKPWIGFAFINCSSRFFCSS